VKEKLPLDLETEPNEEWTAQRYLPNYSMEIFLTEVGLSRAKPLELWSDPTKLCQNHILLKKEPVINLQKALRVLVENEIVKWVSFDPREYDFVNFFSIIQSAKHFSKNVRDYPELDFGAFHFFDATWHLIATIYKGID